MARTDTHPSLDDRYHFQLVLDVDTERYAKSADAERDIDRLRAQFYEVLCEAFAAAGLDGDRHHIGNETPPEEADAADVSEDAISDAQRKEYGDVDGVPFADAEEWIPLKDFDEFYREHRWRLIALVLKVMREYGYEAPIDPEDILQDTMELAVRDWPRIGRMAHPDKYLRTVASRGVHRAMKKSSREVPTSTEGLLTSFEGSLAAGVERSAEDVVVALLLNDALKSLPHRQAQVLLLTADGWSDSEIGEILNIAPATVRSNRRHVRKIVAGKLHKFL